MEKIRLGRSDLEVSRICLGTMTFGEQNTEAEGHGQLDYALSRGINFIDTAEMYPVKPCAETYGRTEKIIGTWLKRQPRDRVVLASKVAGPARRPWVRNGADFTAASIREAVHDSLTRLQTDHIDIYQIHWPNRNAPMFGNKTFDPAADQDYLPVQAQLEVMDELVRAGKIRYVGLSNETPWGVSEFVKQAEIHGLPRVPTIQNPYSLVNRSFEQGLDETCYRSDVSLLAYSPLSFGQLSGKYLTGDASQPTFNPDTKGRLTLFGADWSPRHMRPETIAASARYAALAKSAGLSPATLALAWCYSRWFVASTIIGATRLEQLRENIDAWNVELPDDVVSAVQRIHAEINNPAQ